MDEPSSTGNDDWLTAQQDYWHAWLDLTRQTFTRASPDGQRGIGAEGLQRWWEAVAHAAAPPAQELFGRLVGLTQPYFEMAEQFAGRSGDESNAALDQWLNHMEQTSGGMSRTAATVAPAGAAMALWELPLDTWRLTASSLLPLPGDVLHSTKHDALARARAEMKERRDRFLSIPGIGYTREAQEQYRHLWRLIVEYLEALQQYEFAFVRLGRRSLEHFRRRLDQVAQDTPVDSLRKLYDLWVDACEEVYVEYASSDEYARLFGRLVNALAAVKRQSSVLLDDMLEGMNLPTRREIDTVHRRMHEARRDNHALRADVARINERVGNGRGTTVSTAKTGRKAKPSKTKHH
jgi:polyhydroxyalkanoate synthase subunit PhaE